MDISNPLLVADPSLTRGRCCGRCRGHLRRPPADAGEEGPALAGLRGAVGSIKATSSSVAQSFDGNAALVSPWIFTSRCSYPCLV